MTGPPNPYSIWSDPETQELVECSSHCPSYVIEHIWDWCNDRPDILDAAKALHGRMYIPLNPMDLVLSPIISTTIKFEVGHGLYLAVQMWRYREGREGMGRVETLSGTWKLHHESKPTQMALHLPAILRSFPCLTIEMLTSFGSSEGGLVSILIPFVDSVDLNIKGSLKLTAGFALATPPGAKRLYLEGMMDILDGFKSSLPYLHAIFPGPDGHALPFVSGSFPHGAHYVVHNIAAHQAQAMANHLALHPQNAQRPSSPEIFDTVEPASCGEPSNLILRHPGRVYHFDSPETALRHARTANWVERDSVGQLDDAPVSSRIRR